MAPKMMIIAVVVIAVLVIGFLYKDQFKSTMMSAPVATPTTDQTNITPSVVTPRDSSPSATSQNAIMIKNFAFAPATMTVKIGDSVTWTNQDSAPHSATADDKSWDTGELATGQSGSITFNKAGTFTYHCSVHPNMKATIIVQ